MVTAQQVRVDEDGRVTLPAELREALQVKAGDLLTLEATSNGILIMTREQAVIRNLDAIGDVLRANGVTLEEMIESGREIRGELLREMYGIDPGA